MWDARNKSARQNFYQELYINDDEVEAAFCHDVQAAMCGPAGTCFLEDTYGIHRAGLPVERPRLILPAQYDIRPSPFAPKAPPMRSCAFIPERDDAPVPASRDRGGAQNV